jgi:hypothetical protein
MAKKKEFDRSQPLDNKNRELFCRLYAGNRSGKIFGNATLSYMTAFGYADEVEKNSERMLILNEKGSAAWKKGDKDSHKKLKKEFKTLEDRNKSLKKSAASLGEKLLRNTEINERIDYLFDQYLEPDAMDREMAKVIAQDDDLMSKVAAYDKVAKVRGRLSGKLEGELIVKWQEQPEDPADKPTQSKKAAVKKTLEAVGSVRFKEEGE